MVSRKILILGATGFIGSNVAMKAIQSGWEVYGFSRDPGRAVRLKDAPIHWINGNLEDYNTLYPAMQRVDVVVHAAAYYPESGSPKEVPVQIDYAKEEIQRVVHAAQDSGIRRLVYTSSLTTIGHPPPGEHRLADERDLYQPGTLPKSGYYESKIAMERIFMEACKKGLPGIILNPTAVFGPGDVHLTMASLLIAIAKGRMPVWLPVPVNVVDVRDVAEAHLAAVDRGQVGERYIIGGHNTMVREAFCEVAQIVGVKPPWFELPLWVLRIPIFLADSFPFLHLPTNHLRAVPFWQGYNTDKAKQVLGLNPRPFRETITDTLSWLKENGYL